MKKCVCYLAALLFLVLLFVVLVPQRLFAGLSSFVLVSFALFVKLIRVSCTFVLFILLGRAASLLARAGANTAATSIGILIVPVIAI